MVKNNTTKRKHHHHRDDLIGEHTLGDLGQIILLIIFLIVWILDSFVFHYSVFLSEHVFIGIRIAGAVIILIVSAALARTGLNIVFGDVRSEPMVIRTGVFHWMRHPIYVAAILFYLGLILLTLSVAATLWWSIIICFYYFISRYEEKLLLEKFDEDYKEYMQEVLMWIPRFRKAVK